MFTGPTMTLAQLGDYLAATGRSSIFRGEDNVRPWEEAPACLVCGGPAGSCSSGHVEEPEVVD